MPLTLPQMTPFSPPGAPPLSISPLASDRRSFTARNAVSRGFEPCHPPFTARTKGGAYNSFRPRLEELRKQFLGNGKQSCKLGLRYAIAAHAPGERG